MLRPAASARRRQSPLLRPALLSKNRAPVRALWHLPAVHGQRGPSRRPPARRDTRTSTTRALSGGMKRRLLIATALVHRPTVLFLDEPTAGVDVELRRDLWAYVRKLAAQGTTIVLTTHYLEEAEELAERIGVIKNGRLLVVEEKAELLSHYGRRTVRLQLDQQLAVVPERLRAAGAELAEGGRAP